MTCDDCGCEVGNERAHQTWHWMIDRMGTDLDGLQEWASYLNDDNGRPVEEIDTRGRT